MERVNIKICVLIGRGHHKISRSIRLTEFRMKHSIEVGKALSVLASWEELIKVCGRSERMLMKIILFLFLAASSPPPSPPSLPPNLFLLSPLFLLSFTLPDLPLHSSSFPPPFLHIFGWSSIYFLNILVVLLGSNFE